MPTLAAPATRVGVILGAAAYMSPEQARGSAVDKCADIWTFGVVLCEMLTGQRLFGGETVSDTLAAVLRQEIELSPDGKALLASAALARVGPAAEGAFVVVTAGLVRVRQGGLTSPR